MRLIGLDPGLRNTGWGVIESEGNRLRYVACGVVHSDEALPLASRLCQLFDGVTAVIAEWAPLEAAVEETFVNKNPNSTLKLGQARGAVLLAPAKRGLPAFEYGANHIKKSVVGVGHADKVQVEMMVRRLLPGSDAVADAADALAVAICHAHNRSSIDRWKAGETTAGDESGGEVGAVRGGRIGAGRGRSGVRGSQAEWERRILARASDGKPGR
ncbi:MAG: crossover junction endodeoxyribonuclease RuvC [Rhodospirillales bacterium]|nr:crossover junction endodeoxyribonuclease RuvC [Rhodospirillales bacterium]QQS12278.1 MAG: crossover junction endodeoxyribonuclease RuvC [Rhodospirillales bacterium]